MGPQKTAELTVSTASTSTSSSSLGSLGSARLAKPRNVAGPESSNALVRQLVQKIAEDMSDEYKEKPLEVDLEAIIQAVRTTLLNDERMAFLIKGDHDASFAASDEVFDSIESITSYGEMSDVKSTAQESAQSELSSEFWGGSELSEHYLETSTREGTMDGNGNSSDDQKTFASASSLKEFIRRHNELSSDSEDAMSDNDDQSSISDLSGLTGCFDVSGSGVGDKRKKEVFKDAPPVPVFSSASATKSVVCSIVGSTVSHTSRQNSAKKKPKSRVSFDCVHVRHYERIMTDNPASAGGPSIGIGWKYAQRRPKTVDRHQEMRQNRTPSQILLSRVAREKLIRKLGYTDKEIAACVRELNKARFQRRQTVNNLSACKVEETVETARRMVKQLLFLNKGDKLLAKAENILVEI